MSFLSKMKKAKAAAKDHKERQAQSARLEAASVVPYHHKPAHAAIDAMAGAPSSWKAYDQPAIYDAHRKRLSRPQSAATSITAYTAPTGRLTPGNGSIAPGGGAIARPPPVPKNNSVGTDLTGRSSTGASTMRNSVRSSVGGVSNPPRAQHWGYAAYVGLEAAQQLENRQSQVLGAGRRAMSYHGRSPLAAEPEVPPVHSSSSSRSSGMGNDGLEIQPLPAKSVSFQASPEPQQPRAPGARNPSKRRSADAAFGSRSKTPSPPSGSPVLGSSPLATETLPEPEAIGTAVTAPTAVAAPPARPAPAVAKPAPAVRIRSVVHEVPVPDSAAVTAAVGAATPAASKGSTPPAKKKRRFWRFGRSPVAVTAH